MVVFSRQNDGQQNDGPQDGERNELKENELNGEVRDQENENEERRDERQVSSFNTRGVAKYRLLAKCASQERGDHWLKFGLRTVDKLLRNIRPLWCYIVTNTIVRYQTILYK